MELILITIKTLKPDLQIIQPFSEKPTTNDKYTANVDFFLIVAEYITLVHTAVWLRLQFTGQHRWHR